MGKLREVKEVITLYGRSVNLENKDFRNERYSVYQLFRNIKLDMNMKKFGIRTGLCRFVSISYN